VDWVACMKRAGAPYNPRQLVTRGIGALRIERANVRVYIPVVSILLTSVAATIVLTILGFLFRR
jgi:Protein of unknown function (DUF2905)